MRIRCEYKTKKIPVAYQMMFVSLIKEALRKSDEEYFRKIYFYDKDRANKRSKNFCFSVYLRDFKIDKDEFLIKDRVIFNISSPDYEFMIHVYNGLLNLKQFEFKNQYCINKVRTVLIKEKKINSNSINFTTMSPIFIKDKLNNPLSPKDDNFVKELNYISNEVLKNYRGYGIKKELKFYDMGMKKQVIKEEIRNFTKKTNKKYFYVNAYSGNFQLVGDIEDLNDIYKLGIGFKRSQGFGMLEILG